MAAEECGAALEPWPSPRSRYPEIPGFPQNGRLNLEPYVGATFQFSWTAAEPITAAGGETLLPETALDGVVLGEGVLSTSGFNFDSPANEACAHV